MCIKLAICVFLTSLMLFVGCDPVERGPVEAVLQVAPVATLEEVRNDVRVRIFVERFLRDECRVVDKTYDIKDLYMIPNQSACRYEIEVLTTTEEVYSLTVDLHRDGSMAIPIAKFLPRGESRSRAIDTTDFVSGPLDGNLVERGAGATLDPNEQPTLQATRRPSAQANSPSAQANLPAAQANSPAAQANLPAAQANSRTNSGQAELTAQRRDPNADKLEAYLAEWLKDKHEAELESFLLRGREPTTFNADRYYTQIITTKDSGFEVTVDFYRNGEIRVFRSRKIF